MAIILKQSTASQEILLGPFLDDTDGKTAETGLTIANTDIKIWKAGGTSEASKNSGGATHIAAGRYYAVLDATDTDTLGSLEINVHVAGALPVRRECLVLAANLYDSLIGGTDLLQVDVSQFGNSAGTFLSGRPEVNTTHAAGTAWGSGAITAASIAADAGTEIGTAVWASVARTLTALDEDSTTLDLDATIRAAVGLASDNLDTQIGTLATASNLATVAGYIDTEVAAIKAKTDNLPASPAATGDIPTAAAIADAVWDEAIAGHAGAGSTGESLSAAGAAGDPWITALPGSYSAGQAGYIVGTNLNATVSSRATQTSVDTVDDFLDTEIAAIKAKTDNLPASPAATGDIPTATQNADALLNRDMSAVSDTNSRSPLNALRHIRNKWSISGSTLTVTKEDDATAAWTSTLSTNASADPITGSDPA